MPRIRRTVRKVKALSYDGGGRVVQAARKSSDNAYKRGCKVGLPSQRKYLFILGLKVVLVLESTFGKCVSVYIVKNTFNPIPGTRVFARLVPLLSIVVLPFGVSPQDLDPWDSFCP